MMLLVQKFDGQLPVLLTVQLLLWPLLLLLLLLLLQGGY